MTAPVTRYTREQMATRAKALDAQCKWCYGNGPEKACAKERCHTDAAMLRQAAAEGQGDKLADLERRLRHWTVLNGCERLDGKQPTFLNPWTVLGWMGFESPDPPLPAAPTTTPGVTP